VRKSHAILIEEMRRRGGTYKEIARVLEETCQVKSSPGNVLYFVRLRDRAAKRSRQAQAEQAKQIFDGRAAVSSNVALTRTSAHGLPISELLTNGQLGRKILSRGSAFLRSTCSLFKRVNE
jgi:hypothetical protein